MVVSYKPLWKLLIDKDMTKSDLCHIAHLSFNTVTKLAKNENVTVEVLTKICNALNCDISDVIVMVPDNNDDK